MPELPEVESIRRALVGPLTGKKFVKARLFLKRQWKGGESGAYFRALSGQSLKKIFRHGKVLCLDFEPERLFFHLGMTGRLLVGAPGSFKEMAHLRLLLEFQGVDLAFTDTRTFGRIIAMGGGTSQGPDPTKALGPDALAIPPKFFRDLPPSRRSVKAVLLDQGVLAGVGNIYADEALFMAGIHPVTPFADLTGPRLLALGRAVKGVLVKSVKNRGTTFSDYRLPDGAKGGNQGRLMVYGRGGQPCRRCGTAITRSVVAARGTHVCPRCQGPPPAL